MFGVSPESTSPGYFVEVNGILAEITVCIADCERLLINSLKINFICM